MVAEFILITIYTSTVFLTCPNHSASRSAVSKANYILLGLYRIFSYITYMPIYGINIYQEEFNFMPIFGKLGRHKTFTTAMSALVNPVPLS